MKWLIYDWLGADDDKAIEIDIDVIKATCKMGARKSYDYLMQKYQGDELVYALMRWAFFTGVKQALKRPDEYLNLLLILNTLSKLEADEAMRKLLKAELDGNEELVFKVMTIQL